MVIVRAGCSGAIQAAVLILLLVIGGSSTAFTRELSPNEDVLDTVLSPYGEGALLLGVLVVTRKR